MENLAAINGFMGFLQNIFTNQYNRENIQDTNDMNYKIAKYSYDQQKQMIQEQNEYNSPVQQLQRYKEAGLNPNLIYGEGKASAGMQNQIAKMDVPTMQAPQGEFDFGIDRAIGTFLQLKQLELQNKKTSAEVERMDMENQLTQRYIHRQDSELKYYDLLHADGVNSPAFEDYSAGIRLKYGAIDLQDLEKGFKASQIAFQKLNNREKDFYFKNLLPLMVKAKKLELEGMSYDNIIKRIDSETERLYRQTSIGSNAWRAAYGLGAVLGERLNSGWKKLMKKRSGVR